MIKRLLFTLAALALPHKAAACAVCTMSLVDYYLPPAWGWMLFGLIGMPLLSALIPGESRARVGLPAPKPAAAVSVLTFALLFAGAPLVLLLAGWVAISSLRATRLQLPRRAQISVRTIAALAVVLAMASVATHALRDRVSYLSTWPSSPMSRNFIRLALESGDQDLLERISRDDPETFLLLLEARIEPERDTFLVPLIEDAIDGLPSGSIASELADGYLEMLAPGSEPETSGP